MPTIFNCFIVPYEIGGRLKTELNMNVLNEVIAFKMLEIMRDNGMIDDKKYINIERKRIQYGESILLQNKLYKEET